MTIVKIVNPPLEKEGLPNSELSWQYQNTRGNKIKAIQGAKSLSTNSKPSEQ
jgi:hypothetical protein